MQIMIAVHQKRCCNQISLYWQCVIFENTDLSVCFMSTVLLQESFLCVFALTRKHLYYRPSLLQMRTDWCLLTVYDGMSEAQCHVVNSFMLTTHIVLNPVISNCMIVYCRARQRAIHLHFVWGRNYSDSFSSLAVLSNVTRRKYCSSASSCCPCYVPAYVHRKLKQM